MIVLLGKDCLNREEAVCRVHNVVVRLSSHRLCYIRNLSSMAFWDRLV